MNIFYRFFTKALASVMLAGLCICFVTSVSMAQCPSDIAPLSGDPNYVAWTAGGNQTVVISTGCSVTYLYCYRTLLDGKIQFYVYAVYPTASSNCDDIPPEQQINAAVDDLFQTTSAPPCSTGYVIASVIRDMCWKFVTGDPPCSSCGSAGFVPCTDQITYCSKSCHVCTKPNGTKQVDSCTYTVLNGVPNCQINTGTNWQVNTCYRVPCGQ